MNIVRQKRRQRLISYVALSLFAAMTLRAQNPTQRSSTLVRPFVDQYCANCHDNSTKKGELDLESIASEGVARHPEAWEKVVRKLRTRQMPPPEKKRPDEISYTAMLSRLESSLDTA